MGERDVVNVPVVRVELLEDRAVVTRRGAVILPGGIVHLRVDGVAPVASDKSLSVRGAELHVHDARVGRAWRVRLEDRPLEARELDTRLEVLDDEIETLRERLAAAEAERDASRTFAGMLVAEVAEDAGWGRPAGDRLADLEAVSDRVRASAQAIVDLRFTLETREEARERLRRRKAAHERPSSHAAAWIDVDLEAEAGTHELEIRYVVPGACWRPYHRATLRDEGNTARVRIEGEACVWQNTGEDWDAVELVFSTERPSRGHEPPVLTTEELAVQRKSAVVVSAREEKIETTGLGSAPAGPPKLLGIDDGGQVQRLLAAAPTHVPSDGRPHRVPLFSFESAAELQLVCLAELEPAVVLRTELTHTGSHPLLAGPVDLLRDAGLCGRTRLMYVAPGERFELGFGPQGAFRVQRSIDDLEDESSLLGGWVTQAHDVRVRLSNLDTTPARVRVRERVPVSEIDKVKIAVDAKHTTGGRMPDGDGMLEWDVELAPLGRADVRLRVAIKKSSDVAGL